MATFTKHQIISASPTLIPEMAEAIRHEFQTDGYEVKVERLYGGGQDISITKGGIFKAVLGLKTALKVTLQPRGNCVLFEANVGIFGQQVIPTLITWYITWPVLITQMWGLVEQSKMDDRAYNAAISAINAQPNITSVAESNYCYNCGKSIPKEARFCPYCGSKIQ